MTQTSMLRSHVKRFCVNSLLGNNDSLEYLGIFQEVLVNMGDFLKTKNPKLFEEMMRHFTDTSIEPKIKLATSRRRWKARE